ncbi:MAG: autotransporter outer membrane beta-barrel domain-containing protein [Alphaproteobacteria bacterium]
MAEKLFRTNRFDFGPLLAAAVLVAFSVTDAQATNNSDTTEFNPGSQAVDSQLSRSNTTNFVAVIGNQISRFGGNLASFILTVELPGEREGLAAGYEPERVGVWTNISATNIRDTVTATRYSGELRNYVVGADYRYSDELLAGIALGKDHGEIDTPFNSGKVNTDSKTLSGYASYSFDETFSVDSILGYAHGSFDQVRNAGGIINASDTSFNRWFAQVNGNGVFPIPEVDNLLLAGQAGALYAFERVDDFTETGVGGNQVLSRSNPLTQLQFSGRAGYSFFDLADGWVVHPYGQLRYIRDLQANRVDVGPGQVDHSNDDSEAQLSLGVDFFGGPNLSGNLEFTHSMLRENFRSNAFSVNLRWQFGPSAE